MNFGILITLFATGISAGRLGFHGSLYHNGQFGNVSPQQAELIKKLMKQNCIKKYGRRFC